MWAKWERLAAAALLDRVRRLLTGDVSDRELHLRSYGALWRLTGAGHPLAVTQDEWFFESTGAAIHAEDAVRFPQTGLDLELGEAASVDRRSHSGPTITRSASAGVSVEVPEAAHVNTPTGESLT